VGVLVAVFLRQAVVYHKNLIRILIKVHDEVAWFDVAMDVVFVVNALDTFNHSAGKRVGLEFLDPLVAVESQFMDLVFQSRNLELESKSESRVVEPQGIDFNIGIEDSRNCGLCLTNAGRALTTHLPYRFSIPIPSERPRFLDERLPARDKRRHLHVQIHVLRRHSKFGFISKSTNRSLLPPLSASSSTTSMSIPPFQSTRSSYHNS
jgi:hypothetical protein